MTWYEIFPQILNMSLTASVIICVVLLCRLLLKRAPKIYSYILWSVVIFRLLCPVSLSAPISVLGIFDTPVLEQTSENMGDKETVTSTIAYIPTDIVHTEYPEVALPIPGVGDRISEAVNEKLPSGEFQLRADPLEGPITIVTYLWLLGIVGMFAGGIVSYIRLRGNIVGALKLRDNIYVTDHISGPFVIGMIKPKIYLPSDLDEKEHSYIILHEQHHIRRGDPVFKMVAYIALCIHWFNPLVWLFFKLFVKDMEMSCDEAVVNKLGENIRADYSASLLQLATGRQMFFGSPLAFGETEPAGRIKNISRWKKPTLVISAFAIVLCSIAVIVSIFNPAVSKDTLRMIEQESPVMGNIVKYEVNFGKQVEEANVYAEVWEKGECEVIACLPVDQRAKQLCIQMKDRKADGKTEGMDIRLESDVPGGMQVTYAELPEDFSAIGWAFNAYEEGDIVDAIPGEEKILAAMAFDTGEGVRVFDPETLLKEPSRLEQAEFMLVIRAVFEEEGSRLSSDQTIQVYEDKWDCTVHCAEESGENSYVITYSEKEILADTGRITFQNRNMFAITVHLIGKGKEAFVSEIEPGGNVVFMQADPEVSYTVGIHADVEEGTELSLMVYDGEWSEVYELKQDTTISDKEEGTYYEQWNLIARQKDIWVNYMDYANDLQQYTITDLDGNGRLEVIVSSMGGTGSYTYTRFFEVNESFDGLIECTTDFVEGDSEPDMMIANEPSQVFRDLEGVYHYVIRDFMRAGTEYYDIIYDVVLKNGHVTHNVLARMFDSYSSGSSVVEYTNAAGEKITEAEYKDIAKTTFAGMSELTCLFDWRDLEEIADCDEEKIYNILSEIRSGVRRGNVMMEEVAEGSEYQSEQTTNSWDKELVEAWMKHFSTEGNESIYYVKALENLQINRLLPDGKEAYISEGNVFGNSMAFRDVDADGRKELILNIAGTCIGDMGLYVYQLDEDSGEEYLFYQELAIWPDATFYSNGLVMAMWSHNHGYSANNEFWPFDIYAYEKEADAYVKRWNVDAWEKQLKEVDYNGTEFPDGIDLDGDGMVYRILSEETNELLLMDKADYEEWFAERIEGAEKISINWNSLP